MRKLLNFIKERYGNPELIITENGTSDNDGSLEDEHRVEFYKGYINNILKGMSKCTDWGLMLIT